MQLQLGQMLTINKITHEVQKGFGGYFMSNVKNPGIHNNDLWAHKGFNGDSKYDFVREVLKKPTYNGVGHWPYVDTLDELTTVVKAIKNHVGDKDPI